MEFKDIVKTRRSILGLTLDDIARYVGVSGATVSRWESGDIENIRRDKIAKLAEVLQVTPAYLMGWENAAGEQDLGLTALDTAKRLNAPVEIVEAIMDDMGWPNATDPETLSKISAEIERRKLPPNATPIDFSKYHQIPILGRISAGLPLYAEEHIEGYTLTDLNGGAEYFALRVCGDSMNGLGINDGYLIIVRRQEEVEQGEVAVVLVDNEDATVKRFYATDSTITLMPQSTNPKHTPQIYDLKKTEIRVLGKVVQVMFTL